jgi:AcrR family transcriptional regulator
VTAQTKVARKEVARKEVARKEVAQTKVAQKEVAPHIVDAARHVLAQDGLAAATLERISQAAGVSRMTLHRRGVSKQDILRAIAEQLELEYREAFWPALISKGTGRERLELALLNLCDVIERNLPLHEALSERVIDEIYHDPGPGALTRGEFVGPLERLLLDGAGDGTLAEVDTEETATVLFNAVSHTYAHLRAGHRWSPERARDGVLRLVLAGLDGLSAR